MQITELSSARAFEGGNPRARNLTANVLLVGDEGSPNNYMMALTTADEPHPTPRHKHNFDQIRYVIEGAGHLSNIEGAEEFNRLLREFLVKCDVDLWSGGTAPGGEGRG